MRQQFLYVLPDKLNFQTQKLEAAVSHQQKEKNPESNGKVKAGSTALPARVTQLDHT